MKRSAPRRCSLLTVLFLLVAASASGQGGPWEVSEVPLPMPEGGRANTIAVHPKNDELMYVASESGGLFRSSDGGKKWAHVDELPCFMLSSVAFVPSNPEVVLVTALDDFKVDGGGGVWRGTKNGKNWAHMEIPAGVERGRTNAYEIAIDPDTGTVYVGHDTGLLRSTDETGTGWEHRSVFGAKSGAERRVYSLAALGEGVVLAGGPGGLRRSLDEGDSWSSNLRDDKDEELVVDAIHALAGIRPVAGTALLRQHAFAVNAEDRLFVSGDAGSHWTRPEVKPGVLGFWGSMPGGITFVKAIRRGKSTPQTIDVYFGNSFQVARRSCPRDPATGAFDCSGKWTALAIDHSDTRDVAFDGAGDPILLATDGGLHRTSDKGKSWKLAGAGAGGYNALQIADVTGQTIEEGDRQDLYFGTQDNGFWSSGDGGVSWKRGPEPEGAYIRAERDVLTPADSQITFYRCGSCSNRISGRLFTNTKDWPDPPTLIPGHPTIVERGMHVQWVQHPNFVRGLGVTLDLGAKWQQFARFVQNPRDLPRVATPSGGRLGPAILYQAVRLQSKEPPKAWREIVGLARIVKHDADAEAKVFFPAMNGVKSLGLNPTGNVGPTATGIAKYEVYAIDPDAPLHLIAADVGGKGRMVETQDGGESWTELPQLTELVTDGGRLRFMRPDDPTERAWRSIPIVSAIAFNPRDPQLVLAGTFEGGLYVSADNGTTWARIEGSRGITNASAIHWLSANEAVISTYGRGLWRMKQGFQVVEEEPELLCEGCLFFDFFEMNPIDVIEGRGVIVFDGEVVGATVEGSILKELFVTPASSVYLGLRGAPAASIQVTRTSERVGFRGTRSAPRAPREGWILRGLVIDEYNRVTAAAWGARREPRWRPQPVRDPGGRTDSPTAGKPYLQIVTERFAGLPAAAPDEAVRLSGTDFPAGGSFEVWVDDRPIDYRLQADERGTLEGEIRAPLDFGFHSLEVRSRDGAELVDASMFLVTPVEGPAADDGS